MNLYVLFCTAGFRRKKKIPKISSREVGLQTQTQPWGLWLAGNAGMEKKMEATIMGYMGGSHVPNLP